MQDGRVYIGIGNIFSAPNDSFVPIAAVGSGLRQSVDADRAWHSLYTGIAQDLPMRSKIVEITADEHS
jgi:hypothetical protein